MEALSVASELDLVWALERYIKHNEDEDEEIEQKVRPALNYIRFLTLAPQDIARTTLLSPDEIKNVIESLPPNGELSKMPQSLSVVSTKRAASVSDVDMMKALHEVYSVKFCIRCSNAGTHAVWNCPNLDANRRLALKNVYDEYQSTFLMEYERDDLKAVYDWYKSNNYVN